jgi:hypothetical protein
MVLTTAAVFCRTPGVPADPIPPIQENITATTYMDSRNNTNNYSTSKIKLVANANGTGSNDGSITRGLFRLPTDLDGIPASEIASAKIYFYNYGISPPNYTQPNPPSYTVPDVVLHPLTQSFTYNTATWNNSATGTPWSTPWTTPYSSGGVSGPFEPSVSVTAVDLTSGGKSTANNWSYFDVTSLWSDPDFLTNGVVMMFSNEVVPLDPNYPSNHQWLTENWANQNYTPSSYAPYIVITEVPEPSTLAMTLSGAVLLTIGLGRRWVRLRR